MATTIKCPYCGFEDDICSFPDYFDDGEQIKSLLEDYNLNIVNCGMCGEPIVQELWRENNDK